jgi:hypothetical protein
MRRERDVPRPHAICLGLVTAAALVRSGLREQGYMGDAGLEPATSTV